MKKLLILVLIVTSFSSVAQNKINTHEIITDSAQYQELKASGKLGKLISSGTIITMPSNSSRLTNNGIIPPASIYTSSCYGYTPPNLTAIPSNINTDDIPSTGPISFPFNFCFYGTNYTSFYINTNGNITFGSAYTTFTAAGFPSATIPAMLAPFWGDVDTRGGNGSCHYDVFSNAVIIHWENVGYYNTHGDKLNTFQLIITDFTSPLLQPGNNVGFFYDNMDWTTGDASGGTNGFGGTAATVGVNQGNGVDYIQIGRFDGPGNFYDGPILANDSVDWLDNKTFMFNVCNSTNIPPIVAGIDFCDTIRLCVGDTFPINVTFLAGEASQTIWASADTSQASGYQINSNTSGSGSSAQINSVFIADTSNIGVNIITFTTYDNGTPPDTITFDYIIIVDSLSMIPVITGDTIYCSGSNVVLDAGSGFDSYVWSNGDITQLSTVTQGNYTVQAFLGGCSFTTPPYTVSEYLTPVVTIIGDTIVCAGDSALLNATSGFNSYLWSTSVNDTLDSIYVVTQGTYTVTIIDSNGCQGISSSFVVNNFANTVNIVGDTIYCLGDSVLLDVGSIFDSYLWSTGDTTQTIYVTQGTYSVIVSLNTCSAVDSQTVNLVNVPIPVITGSSSYCAGGSVTLDADSISFGYNSYSWSTSPGQTTQTIVVTQGTYTVTVTSNGCPATSIPYTVIENQLPTPTILGNLHYCANDSNGTLLSIQNSYNQYIWSNGDTNSTIFASTSPPNYSITVVDTNGCQGVSQSVNITSSNPNNIINGATGFCPSETITISSNSGFSSYLWNTGDTSSAITVGAGTYIATVFDAYGCLDKDTVILVAHPAPVANFVITPPDNGGTNESITFTDASTINFGNIVSWNWDFDVNNIGGVNPSFAITQGPHVVIYNLQGTYSVSLTIISDSNCLSTITQDYLIVDDIIVPNIITPNGDNYNDFLVFKNLEYHSGNKLIILNRWGNKVFEKENYNNDWDGGGHSEGTYYFILTVEDLSEPIKGAITILK